MDLLQEHFEFQQPLVQVDGRVRDVQKVSGYIFRRIWKNSGFVEYYQSLTGKKLCARNIRSVCTGKRNHVNNMQFEYITQEQFNQLKEKYPDKVYGELFVSYAS